LTSAKIFLFNYTITCTTLDLGCTSSLRCTPKFISMRHTDLMCVRRLPAWLWTLMRTRLERLANSGFVPELAPVLGRESR